MKYIAIIDADEKPVSCEFIGCNGNVGTYWIGATTNIKALDQESILDKISSEIEEIETYDGLYIDRFYVLQIIDKYKAESLEEVKKGAPIAKNKEIDNYLTAISEIACNACECDKDSDNIIDMCDTIREKLGIKQ